MSVNKVWGICLVLLLLSTVIVADMDHEERLLKNVFDTIDPRVRPVRSWNETVDIRVEMFPLFFKGLNEPLQVMDMYGWISLHWNHPKLTWNPADYGGIDTVTIPAVNVWVPDVGIINSANHLYDGVFEHEKYRAIAHSDGSTRVVFSANFQTICLLDVTYFPFDEQLCHIEFDIWSLPMSKARFSDNSTMGLSNLRENGIWSITETWHGFSLDLYRGVYFRTLSFTFRLQRKPLFVLSNVAAPCVILFLLELLVFCIPPEAGEKISLGITLMLSLTVFQLVIQDSMPATSDFFPFMSMYLVGVTMLSAITLILTVVVLSIHHRDEDLPLPTWINRCFISCLGPCLGFPTPEEPPSRKKSGETGTGKKMEEDNLLDVSKTSQVIRNSGRKADWILLAKILDRFFFVFVLILAIVLTVGTFAVCKFGGMSRDKPLSGYGYVAESGRPRTVLRNNEH